MMLQWIDVVLEAGKTYQYADIDPLVIYLAEYPEGWFWRAIDDLGRTAACSDKPSPDRVTALQAIDQWLKARHE